MNQLFPSQTRQNHPFVILLCPTPGDFTRQGTASGCESVILLCLTPGDFTRQGTASGCESVILLCLTPGDFTRQGTASGCERVNWAYLPISFP